MERYRTPSQAFRAFDFKAQGTIRKYHFVLGLDNLRIKLTVNQIDTLWSQLDPTNKGFIHLSDFCRLAEMKTSSKSDPFDTKAIVSATE